MLLDSLKVIDEPELSRIVAGDQPIVTVFDHQATAEGVPRYVLDQRVQTQIAECIRAYRRNRSPRALVIHTGYALGVTLAAVLLVLGLRRTHVWLEAGFLSVCRPAHQIGEKTRRPAVSQLDAETQSDLSELDKMVSLNDQPALCGNVKGNQTMSANRATGYRLAAMRRVWLCPMVLVLMIAGCTAPIEVPYSEPAMVPATAFDGSYRAGILPTYASVDIPYSWCDTPGQLFITVANGQFSYAVRQPYFPPGDVTPVFYAAIAQDGSFVGLGDDGTGHVFRWLRIYGQVRGTHMEGTIEGVKCKYIFIGDRT